MDGEITVEIDDPSDLSQSTRIQEILDRRKRAIDSREEAMDMLLLGELDERAALEHYRTRIVSLIIDIASLFGGLDYATQQRPQSTGQAQPTEMGRRYFARREIDTIKIAPPDAAKQSSAPGYETPDSQTITIAGLAWFVKNRNVTASFVVRTMNPPETQTIQQKRPIPLRTLDMGLLTCEKLLDEAGIDADLVDDQGDAGFTYEDILWEGPAAYDEAFGNGDGQEGQ